MKRVRSGLRLTYDMNTWLIQEAQKQGVSKNALILQILWEWLERRGKKNDKLTSKKDVKTWQA